MVSHLYLLLYCSTAICLQMPRLSSVLSFYHSVHYASTLPEGQRQFFLSGSNIKRVHITVQRAKHSLAWPGLLSQPGFFSGRKKQRVDQLVQPRTPGQRHKHTQSDPCFKRQPPDLPTSPPGLPLLLLPSMPSSPASPAGIREPLCPHSLSSPLPPPPSPLPAHRLPVVPAFL